MRPELVFAAVELDAGEFPGLAVFGDRDVLLAEIFEQVFAGVGAIAGTADDADDVVEMVERDLVADQDVFALFGLCAARRWCGGGPLPRGAR